MSQHDPVVDLLHLSSVEKLELIGQLWDSMSDSLTDLPIPDWHKTELDRRLAEADANPQAAKPWSEVEKRLKQRP